MGEFTEKKKNLTSDLELGDDDSSLSSLADYPGGEKRVQIGIAFYETVPISQDHQNPLERANPVVQRARQEKGFWGKWIEDPLIRYYAKDMKYRHCEMIFTQDLINNKKIPTGYVLAYGIIRNGELFGKFRTFSAREYKMIWFLVTEDVCKRMQRFCESQKGRSYDAAAAKRSVFWPKKCDYKKWYCTDFVVTALQQGDMMLGKNPRAQTTDDVYDIMSLCSQKVVRESPYRRLCGDLENQANSQMIDSSRMVHMDNSRRKKSLFSTE